MKSHRRRSDVFIVNFEYISHLVLEFLLLTLTRSMQFHISIPSEKQQKTSRFLMFSGRLETEHSLDKKNFLTLKLYDSTDTYEISNCLSLEEIKISVSKQRKKIWIMIWGEGFKSRLSKFFKGCLPQNLLGPLLNTLSHIIISRILWTCERLS